MARELTRSELPYETYERLTGKKWTSGKSADVTSLLNQYGIKAPAGSEQANNELQRALKADKSLVGERPTLPEPKGITPGPIPTVGSALERGYQAMKGSKTSSVLDEMPNLPAEEKAKLAQSKEAVNLLAQLALLPVGGSTEAPVMTARGIAPMAARNFDDFQKAYRAFMNSPNLSPRAKALFNAREDVQKALDYLVEFGRPY